jgi:hypothetical protein
MKQVSLAVAVLLALSLILIIGMGGTGLSASVVFDQDYNPYVAGSVRIEVKNGWWGRTIHIQDVLFAIENIQTFDWGVQNYSGGLAPGALMSIAANLTIEEWTSGTFNCSLTIVYTESTLLWFGSANSRRVINGTLVIA